MTVCEDAGDWQFVRDVTVWDCSDNKLELSRMRRNVISNVNK